MKRSLKPAEARRSDMLNVAEDLVLSRGLEGLSIEEVARGAGVAKGTFYLHFRSRRDLLAELGIQVIRRMADAALAVGARIESPSAALVAILEALKTIERQDARLAEALHRAENRELNEWCNIALIRLLGPPLAAVVERGCATGEFSVPNALATVEFILAGQAFLLGADRFGWSEAERAAREQATLTIIERALGANDGTLRTAMTKVLTSARSAASSTPPET
ncbi:MAG: transcriptional regulator [Phenylobacterium zucineum]|nr:MAG: transcriptional regulator [Phenylobacterium zucineum]